MNIKRVALALLVALFFAATALPSRTAAQTGLSQPITGTLENGGTFTGNLNITEFAVKDDRVVAIGTLTGTLLDASGTEIGNVDNEDVEWTVQTSATEQDRRLWLAFLSTDSTVEAESGNATNNSPVAIAQTCDILNLVLGPLDLNLLGLEVHLDTVILDIIANPAGGLLGNLLCAVANLLDNPLADLLQIVNLLNDILDLLN